MGRSTPTVALASSSGQSIRSATLTQAMPPMHTVGSYVSHRSESRNAIPASANDGFPQARTSSSLMAAARNESLFVS